MSVTKADISLAAYLTMARKKAGYNSPYDAERAGVPNTTRSIYRHESGETIPPDSLVSYARSYDAPELLIVACNSCPVFLAQQNGRKNRSRPLAEVAVQLANVLRRLDIADSELMQIAEDGRVRPDEVAIRDEIDAVLADVIHAVQEARLNLIIHEEETTP